MLQVPWKRKLPPFWPFPFQPGVPDPLGQLPSSTNSERFRRIGRASLGVLSQPGRRSTDGSGTLADQRSAQDVNEDSFWSECRTVCVGQARATSGRSRLDLVESGPTLTQVRRKTVQAGRPLSTDLGPKPTWGPNLARNRQNSGRIRCCACQARQQNEDIRPQPAKLGPTSTSGRDSA